ncbi:hypothetical protein IDH14_04570 [Pelagibacterales bacterium SAG-MED33]|nr:hypothetical protein [Pelagibacterales bacterium SAG-MED33]
MTKPNLFVKNLKNISKSINSLLEGNLNKLKFDNLKILASNNKFILTFVALFFLFVSYLLAPTFYKQGDISKELKNELLNKFNLDFNFNQKLNYNFFPRPHFVSSESSILENQNKIAEIDKLKIYVSLNNFFSLKNVDIKEVILENTNFELNIQNSNFFVKLLDNNFLDTNLSIKNSNIFFRDSENEILFINIIKNLKYYYDLNELKNILYSENEVFNTPFSLKVINHKDETKLYTKLDLDFAKLQIENIFNYKDDIKSGSAALLFNKDKSLINYKINKNFFEFDYSNELENKKFLYKGKFNFNPFYSSIEGDTEEINLSYIFGTNAIVAELLKTKIFNNKNLDFKLNINANKIKNKPKFTNLFLKSKIQEGLIDIDHTKLEWKDSSVIKLTDTLIFVRDGKLFLDGKSKIKITNAKNIYKFLLTPKNYRKNIKTIDFNFSYSFNEKGIILNDIMIDGKYNQKVNSNLNNIYFRGSSRQNKIFLKNMINDLLKFYSG